MKVEGMEEYIPKDWDYMDLTQEKYKIVVLSPHSFEYQHVKSQVLGNYYVCIENIFRVQNPLSYTKFKLKEYEYLERGPVEVKTLFHDTSRENVDSIACYNFDWRYGERFMFGPGVYFSNSPYYANKHSSKHNGLFRTMFLATVLLQNVQEEDGDVFLPDKGYDTVLCHRGCTYVKYFDNEFYPNYFVNYINAA